MPLKRGGKVCLKIICSGNKKAVTFHKVDYAILCSLKRHLSGKQLLVELLYKKHFYKSDSLILEHHHCEKNSKIFI